MPIFDPDKHINERNDKAMGKYDFLKGKSEYDYNTNKLNREVNNGLWCIKKVKEKEINGREYLLVDCECLNDGFTGTHTEFFLLSESCHWKLHLFVSKCGLAEETEDGKKRIPDNFDPQQLEGKYFKADLKTWGRDKFNFEKIDYWTEEISSKFQENGTPF